MLGFIADSTTGDWGVGNDDITTILKSLIFTTFLRYRQSMELFLNLGNPLICCGQSRTQKRFHPVDAYFMIKDEIITR